MSQRTVAVIAAHPDDEILGCGGTIANHIDRGDEVHVLIMAEGLTSRDAQRDVKAHGEQLVNLRQSAHAAAAIVGSTSVSLLDFPDNRMDGIELLDVVKKVEDFVQQYAPSVIYTHHAGDLNVDHQRVHQAVLTACRPQPKASVDTILFFEVPSSTEWNVSAGATAFVPNWYVDIENSLERKQRALQCYAAEMRPWPHARSVDAVTHLARWRGASVGVEAAEAFMLGRRKGII